MSILYELVIVTLFIGVAIGSMVIGLSLFLSWVEEDARKKISNP